MSEDQVPRMTDCHAPTHVRCGIRVQVFIDNTCDLDALGETVQEACRHIVARVRIGQRPDDPAPQFHLDAGFQVQLRHNLDRPGQEEATQALETIMARAEVAALERMWHERDTEGPMIDVDMDEDEDDAEDDAEGA